jgi:soluble lytic murein transglycosylase-like protein
VPRRGAALACALAFLAAAARGAAPSPADDPWSLCGRAIAAAEPGSGLPPGLLGAIALVESGRRDPGTGRVAPWPWAYNVEGEPRFAETREAAVAEVAALRARGVRSVDIGCMQVNLQHHAEAFGSVEQAFDPAANVRYAIRFLRALRARTGGWADAIAQYHSGEALRGLAYHRRVVLARIGAAFDARAGGAGAVALPRGATAGLCAAGRRPVLVMRAPAARRAGAAAARPRIRCRRAAGREPGPFPLGCAPRNGPCSSPAAQIHASGRFQPSAI